MVQTQSPEDLIKRYLLGELSMAERIALEDEYFGDRAKYDQINRIEDELIDRYERGALSPADRERFDQSYMINPWRRRHVMFARALTQVIDGERAGRSVAQRTPERRNISWRSRLAALHQGLRFAWGLTLVFSTFLIVFGGTWFAIKTSRLRSQLAEAQREAEAQRQSA